MQIKTSRTHKFYPPANKVNSQNSIPESIESKWEIDTESVLTIAAFILALVFIIFLGIGWLNDRATTAQFAQAGTSITSGFISIIIGLAEVKKEKQGSKKSKVLRFARWFFIALAIAIGGYALFWTF